MSNSRSSSKSTCSCGSKHCNRYAQEKKRDSKQKQKAKVYYVCGCKGGKCSCYYRKEGEKTWRPVTVKRRSENESKSSTAKHKEHGSKHESKHGCKHGRDHYSCECHGSRCRCSGVKDRKKAEGRKAVTVKEQAASHKHSHSGAGRSDYGWPQASQVPLPSGMGQGYYGWQPASQIPLHSGMGYGYYGWQPAAHGPLHGGVRHGFYGW